MPEVANALYGAIDRGEISVAWQPQIDLAQGGIVGAEALSRWTHPEFGAVAPATFIPIAEETGLIGELGRFAAEAACSALEEWDLDLAVNVSPSQLETDEFTEWLADCLADHRGRARALTIEITETRAIDDVATVLRRLAPLREIGVGVALDDFGTGHASLTQLKRLHGTEVKIDRSIVADMSAAAGDRMAEVVALARDSGIRVVAEGIETVAHLQRARDVGCDRGQGYLLGAPMPRGDLDRLLAA